MQGDGFFFEILRRKTVFFFDKNWQKIHKCVNVYTFTENIFLSSGKYLIYKSCVKEERTDERKNSKKTKKSGTDY